MVGFKNPDSGFSLKRSLKVTGDFYLVGCKNSTRRLSEVTKNEPEGEKRKMERRTGMRKHALAGEKLQD